MATNQVRMKAILEAVKDAVVTDAFVDKTADASVYNSSDREIQLLLNDTSITKANITTNQKRAVFLEKLKQAFKDSREKAAADKADTDALAAKAAAIAAANIE